MEDFNGLLSSEVMQELVKAVPFAAFSIIVLVIVSVSYHKNLTVIKSQSDNAIAHIEKAYSKSLEDFKEMMRDLGVTKKE